MTTVVKPDLSRQSAGSNWSRILSLKTTSIKPANEFVFNCEENIVQQDVVNQKKKNKSMKTAEQSFELICNKSSKFSGLKNTDSASCSSTLMNNTVGLENVENSKPLSKTARNRNRRKAVLKNKILAMDCEMVGTGPNGADDMLARVSIVNQQGEVLLDKFVKPREPVTDYRTSVSGVRPSDIENGVVFEVVQDEVVELLQNKILVGHGIRKDLAVLYVKHPYANVRDTAHYKPLARLVSNGFTPSLKRLCKVILGVDIQTGEHNSVEDARAAMNIYNRLRNDWEKYILDHKRRGKH